MKGARAVVGVAHVVITNIEVNATGLHTETLKGLVLNLVFVIGAFVATIDDAMAKVSLTKRGCPIGRGITMFVNVETIMSANRMPSITRDGGGRSWVSGTCGRGSWVSRRRGRRSDMWIATGSS